MLAALCRSCAARAALAYARVPRGEAPVNSGRLRWRAQAAGAANASLWESTEQFWYVKYALAAVLDPSARRLELDEPSHKMPQMPSEAHTGGRIQTSKSGI